MPIYAAQNKAGLEEAICKETVQINLFLYKYKK